MGPGRYKPAIWQEDKKGLRRSSYDQMVDRKKVKKAKREVGTASQP